MGRLTALLAGAGAVALLVVGVGCGERSEPTGRTVSLYPVTVPSDGDRTLVARGPAKRIAVLSPGPWRTLVALGAGSRIVGSPVDQTGAIQLRKLRQLRPDLIVASSGFDEVSLSRAAAATRTPVYVAADDSIRETERAITQLGLLTDTPVTARRLVHAIEERRRFVEAKLEPVRFVSVFVDTGFFTTVSDHSLIGDLIREARGRNVAGPSPEPGPFDLRKLARLDPAVYLATSDSETTLRSLRRDRRTRRLAAVRKGRFATVDAALLEPGPRIGDGLLVIARLLHPDAFR